MANRYAIHIVDKDGDGMFRDKVFNSEDMFFEILLRVRPEEIYKQILVSKRFHQVVCSYLFCRAYLAHWNQSWHPGFNLIGFLVRNMTKLRGRPAPLPIPACRLLPTSRLGDQIQDSGVLKKLGFYIDSSNGILLFGRHPNSYYLWDPSVRRHHQIPQPPPPRVHFKSICMSLVIPSQRSEEVGYQYKLIKVDCNSCQAETFYSATNTWSCSQLISFEPVKLLPWVLGKVIDGVCFWFTTKGGLAVYNSNDQHCLILRVITLPTLSPINREPLSSEVLGEADGSLLYGSNDRFELALWRLENNDGNDGWIPLRRVSLWDLSFSTDRKIQNIQLIGFVPMLDSVYISLDKCLYQVWFDGHGQLRRELIKYGGVRTFHDKPVPCFCLAWPCDSSFAKTLLHIGRKRKGPSRVKRALLRKKRRRSAMDEEYEVIVLGTGLKECILSALLSVDGVKVLHMDRNDYCGGESTSLNFKQLLKKFRGNDWAPGYLGQSRSYNLDMMPKFMMGNGKLFRLLIRTGVTKYLSFEAVDGSYVFVKGKVQKVPVTLTVARKYPLMGIFEKSPLMGICEQLRAGNFFSYVQDYDEKDPKTHNGMDLTKLTTKEMIAKFGLGDNTIDVIGHVVALHTNDQYLNQPALDTVMRMKLYAESLARIQGSTPYIHPAFGLGALPKAFARLRAPFLNGGPYILNKPECKVEFDAEGKVIGVTSEGETAKCKKIVCDPSYLPGKVRKIGRVARAIAIMRHPIPNTNDSRLVQVIIPPKQLGRKSDMYVLCFPYPQHVTHIRGFIAFVSTESETDDPETELKPGLDLLGDVDDIFFEMCDRYEPVNEPDLDKCFISTSYDATTNFETTVADVLNMYHRITGKELDLNVDLSAASVGPLFCFSN